MCEAGRIKHHLKHNLWRKECTILFVGYQAIGTLGRNLVDGKRKVKLFGEEITVNARIETIDGFSGHADKDGLISWISKMNRKPKKIFIVHGEEEGMNEFSGLIQRTFNIDTIIPDKGGSYVVNARQVIENLDKPQESYKFKRLAIIEQLEILKEEFNELAEILKADLKQEKDDLEIDE
jgi:metallo-beta-lactamase family protein